MATPVSGADAWLTLNNVALSFQPSNENITARATEYASNKFRITANAPDDLEIRIDDELLETERYGRWDWRPRGFAGLYKFSVSAHGYPTKTALIRVLPSKLSYERYREMLAEISEISVDLLFQLRSPASEKATFQSRQQRSSALRDYQLIHSMMPQLELVISQIRHSPHRALNQHVQQHLLHEIHRFTSEVLPVPGTSIEAPSGVSHLSPLRSLPEVWLSQESILTFDVYENQLLKHFLWRQLLTRIHSIEERADSEIKRRKTDRKVKIQQGWADDESERIAELELVAADCKQMVRRCIAWGSEPFLKSVTWPSVASRPTQVLQKHPYYSRFYTIYLRFQQELGLILNSDRYLARLSVRKMSELYEVWSVFRVTQLILELLMRSGYEIVSDDGFFAVRDDQFHFEVSRHAAIQLAEGSNRVVIRYEPLYPPARAGNFGLVSIAPQQRTPDLGVELWQHGRAVRVLMFDAKYRTETVSGRQTYREEDLSKMSDYLHVIRWRAKDLNQLPRKVVSSAYILYPGGIIEHDPSTPETGALPLLPRMQNLSSVVNALREMLQHANLL